MHRASDSHHARLALHSPDDSTYQCRNGGLTPRDHAQAWVVDGEQERLIVGCVTGEVLVVESLDLKSVLHTEGGSAADCIVPFSKGFLVGQSNGAVAMFERDDRDSFLRSKVRCQGKSPEVASGHERMYERRIEWVVRMQQCSVRYA